VTIFDDEFAAREIARSQKLLDDKDEILDVVPLATAISRKPA
jgi:hypothetical protein